MKQRTFIIILTLGILAGNTIGFITGYNVGHYYGRESVQPETAVPEPVIDSCCAPYDAQAMIDTIHKIINPEDTLPPMRKL